MHNNCGGKVSIFPFLEAYFAIFCQKNVCSYFCLVHEGWGSWQIADSKGMHKRNGFRGGGGRRTEVRGAAWGVFLMRIPPPSFLLPSLALSGEALLTEFL